MSTETARKQNILSLSYGELGGFLAEAGEAGYRTGQIFPRLHKGVMPRDINNVPKRTAELLEQSFDCSLPAVEKKLVSAIDGTAKYLFRLSDGNMIESVLMKYEHGNTICVSSQVGCRMGCRFCASTIGGRVRDLEAGEILGQIIAAERDGGERIDNVVMMGIGEPLDNYDNVLRFLRILNDPRGICIGYRHLSLSTCGHVEGIKKLAAEKLPITLSISLHAHDDATRSEIMPVNRKWNIAALMEACRVYRDATGRRISFEYTLIKDRNCTRSDAAALAGLLNGSLRGDGERYPVHVNLIPVNRVAGTGLGPPSAAEIAAFRGELERKGIRATVRRTLGPDISASCGQLRRGYSSTQN